MTDRTGYVFQNLGQRDANHAGSDDVRAAAIAVLEAKERGVRPWLGISLCDCPPADRPGYIAMTSRALAEIEALLRKHRVR